MSHCTEFEILPAQEVERPKKRRRIEWPKVAPGCIRVFENGSVIHDVPKGEHLAYLQAYCENDDIQTTVLGEVISTKGNATGRQLVLYHSVTSDAKQVIGAQSAKTGALVNVQKTDIDKVPALLEQYRSQQAAYKKEVQEDGAVLE